jgi:hypothetical protein
LPYWVHTDGWCNHGSRRENGRQQLQIWKGFILVMFSPFHM